MDNPTNGRHPHAPKEEPMARRAVFVLAGFLLVALAFSLLTLGIGMKTGFFNRWVEDQYFGKIKEIREHSFILADQEGGEKFVLIKEDTRIRRGQKIVSEETLASGNYVIVIGSPIEGNQIEARVIRVFLKIK